MSNRRTEAAITQIADQAGLFSLNCTDVAGAVSEVSALMSAQAEAVTHLRDATATLDERRGDVGVATRSIESSLQEITATSDRSAQSVGLVADNIRELADAVAGLEERIGNLTAALDTVAQVSTVINGIARQTNLLALNATIEAARAGEAGRGFTVVASEVKKLSGETSSATEQIQEVLERLSSQTEGLISNIRESSGMAQAAQAQVTDLIQSFEDMQRVTGAATECNEQIGHASEAMADACQRVDQQLTRVSDGSMVADRKLKEADDRLGDLVSFSEKLIHITATTDVETADTHYIRLARETAHRIETLFEEALTKGEITLDALFDTHYVPVLGSDPAQVTTKFTALTDRLLPSLQDALLSDERIVFCAAVDRNGYLPTHNSKFSKPQRAGDPVWNATNCRNRRIFNDRVGLRAGQSEEEFALQTYRRDMGGGVFAMMKDVSAPITVRGRHWGGFRMGVKAE